MSVCMSKPDAQDDRPYFDAALARWRRAAAQPETHCLFTDKQDADLEWIGSMTAAVPEAIISLASPHTQAHAHCAANGLPWYTTADGVGPVYVLPRMLLAAFLTWRDAEVLPSAALNAEAQVDLWAMATGRNIWHPALDVGPWAPSRPVPHVGRMGEREHWRLVTHLKTPLPLRAYALEQDRQ